MSLGTPATQGGNLAEAVQGLIRCNNPKHLKLVAYVAIGASGAPTVSQNGVFAAITVTRTGTGTYTGTFPPMAASATSLCVVRVGVALSAAVTVRGATLTALSPTAGTFGFTTSLNTAGTGVDPANGDALSIEIEGQLEGSF